MKKAFTLAEVLITLLIIGVVAALTIPSVIANAQQQEFKTGLKKAVSVLNEAIQINIAQEGETPYDTEDLFLYLTKHMSILKSGAFSEVTRFFDNNKTFYTTDGMRFEIPRPGRDENGPRGIGSIVFHESNMHLLSKLKHCKGESSYWGYPVEDLQACHCGSYGLANNTNNTNTLPCIVLVDVNGDKKPTSPFQEERTYELANGFTYKTTEVGTTYKVSSPFDKKLSDIFTIMITDEKAVPFGVVAQRAMYSK